MANGIMSNVDETSPPSARKEFSLKFFEDALANDPIAQLGFDPSAAAMFPNTLTDNYSIGPAGATGKIRSKSDHPYLKEVARVRPDLEGQLGLMYHPNITTYDPAFKAVVMHESRHRTKKLYPEVYKAFDDSIYAQGNFNREGEELLQRFIDMRLFPESKEVHQDYILDTIEGLRIPNKDKTKYVTLTYDRLESDMNEIADKVIEASTKLLGDKNIKVKPKKESLLDKGFNLLGLSKPDYEKFNKAMPFYEYMKKNEKEN
jgi:hypothetical protein